MKATSSGTRDSRVLVFSQRCLAHDPWMASQYEFEDLVGDVDDAQILAPAPEGQHHLRGVLRRAANAASTRIGRARRSPNWRASNALPTRVASDHDVFFGVFHFAHQLAYLHRLDGWRDRCRTRVCFLVETWTPSLVRDRDYLELLREFDRVYTFNQDLIPGLEALGVRAPAYLPVGADTLARSPLPHPPARAIDVYSYGRRSARIHRTLLDLAAQQGLMYVYDSLESGLFDDHREHRQLQANLMKRSRYFIAHTINETPQRRARTGGDEGLSFRYFEAAAAGAVILGSRPDTPIFDEMFPWEDAIVPLPWESGDAAALLAELDARPERLDRIRASSVQGSLRAHDWAHRWSRILDDIALPRLDALNVRLDALRMLAGQVTPDAVAGREPSEARDSDLGAGRG